MASQWIIQQVPFYRSSLSEFHLFSLPYCNGVVNAGLIQGVLGTAGGEQEVRTVQHRGT